MKKTLVSALTTALVVGAASTTFAAANPFEDVPADHWAYDAIAQLAADGVIEGYGDGTYRGDQEITRYEMAQMIARAMAKGGGDKALIDKLAAEFADELNNLGVRVSALEKKVDNVKWGGKLRYRYIHMNHEWGPNGEHGDDDRTNTNQLLLRFEPQMKINEHWTGKARLDYAHTNNMDDAKNEDKVLVDRMWVQGDYKNLQIHLGKLTYATKADYGLVINRYLSGGSVIFGNDIKVALSIGRMNDKDSDIGAGYAWKAGVGSTKLSKSVDDTDITDAASTYGAIEIYNDRKNKFTWGLGYHRFGNRDFDSVHSQVNEAGALERYTNGVFDSDHLNVFNLGLGYKFTPKLSLTAAWSRAFGIEIDSNKMADTSLTSAARNSYAFQLNYGGADAKKPGSWGAYIAWRQLGQLASTGWTTYSLNGPQYTGSRGFEIGASWAPMKNVTGIVAWFTGKDMKWNNGAESVSNQNLKVNTIFTEWNFLF